ncbi:ATP phosphoribosyltransferase regulatory subunit [Christensenellaceae bacterium OttesenSCG-928-K19]|nr:ATP phosphoribosyltransferase regulatory subunit [Christensenellaceae bacterium OttesenSCG-928-K19]
MNKLKLQAPVGTGDYLPDECAEKRRLEQTLRETFQMSGYDEIETPSYEYYDVFMHDAVQYVQENIIKFFDARGRILALRPDMTGPIARMAATKLLEQKRALRLCYVGNVYGFKSNEGRSEYTQAGVELIGKAGAEADAEVIALAIRALLAVGMENFKIDIGQVSFFKGLLMETDITEEQAERIRLLIDTKNSVELEYELSCMNVDREIITTLLELTNLFGGVEVLDRAKALAKNETCIQAVENLKEVYDMLCDFGYGQYLSIDFGLLNNFNYYSGILFRGIADGVGVPMLSGGRYDELLREFGSDAPATGFAIGIKELLVVLESQGMLKDERQKVTVIKCRPQTRKRSYAYAQELRGAGKRVILDMNGAEYDAEYYDIITFE